MHTLRSVLRALLALTLSAITIALASADATAQASAAANPAPKKWYDTITIKGFLQFDTVFPEGASRAGEVSNIRVRRARPTIQAQVDPLTRIQVQFDLSTARPYTGNPSGGSGQSNAMVTDTFADHTFPGLGYVRVGQMLLPFSREVHEDNAAVRSPLELSYAAEAVSLNERDLGILLGSQVPEEQPLHWEFGFFNGQGWRTADANANKTWMGRLATYVHPKVRVGLNGITGTYKDTSGKGSGLTYRRDVLSGELAIHATKAITLSGEIYNCLFVDNPAAATKAARFTGGYLLLESWIGSLKSIPYVRYQRTYGDLSYRSIDLGWRYQYAPNQRFTVEYDIVRAANANALGARWQLNF